MIHLVFLKVFEHELRSLNGYGELPQICRKVNTFFGGESGEGGKSTMYCALKYSKPIPTTI